MRSILASEQLGGKDIWPATAGRVAYVSFRSTRSDSKCASPYSKSPFDAKIICRFVNGHRSRGSFSCITTLLSHLGACGAYMQRRVNFYLLCKLPRLCLDERESAQAFHHVYIDNSGDYSHNELLSCSHPL
jgi:hypothetical protein